MADLTAKFRLIDEMSDKLSSMAESGQQMVDQFERAGATANSAFDGISRSTVTTAGTIDGVAMSVDSLQGAAQPEQRQKAPITGRTLSVIMTKAHSKQFTRPKNWLQWE